MKIMYNLHQVHNCIELKYITIKIKLCFKPMNIIQEYNMSRFCMNDKILVINDNNGNK